MLLQADHWGSVMFDWSYWHELFEARARTLVIRRPPPDDRLTDGERTRIGDSLGTFQLGEQSEGLVRCRPSRKLSLRNAASRSCRP